MRETCFEFSLPGFAQIAATAGIQGVLPVHVSYTNEQEIRVRPKCGKILAAVELHLQSWSSGINRRGMPGLGVGVGAEDRML